MQDFMDTDQLAEYLGYSRVGIERMRELGTGPTYYKFGRFVRYSKKDIAAWLELHKVTGRTEEAA